MAAVQIFANEHAAVMRENRQLREENLRLRREIEQLRARLPLTPRTTTAIAPFVAPLLVGGPAVVVAAPVARPPIDGLVPIPEPTTSVTDDAVLRFTLLELD